MSHGSSFHRGHSASGPMTVEKREVGDFHGIDIGSAFEVITRVGPKTSLTVEAPSDALSYIESSVHDGILKVGIKGSLDVNGSLRLTITTPILDSADLNGACQLHLTDVKSDMFELNLSGASKATVTGTTKRLNVEAGGASHLEWDGLKCDSAKFSLSGGTHVKVGGTSESVDVRADGGAGFDGAGFKAVTVEAKGSGASNLTVNASEKLHADASGASTVSYSGAPKALSTNTSGASSIHRN